MNTIIIPGYGDTDRYIKHATKNWHARHGLDIQIHRFGWYGEADSYDEKWAAFEQRLLRVGETAIVGISAGASVALRALSEHPELVKKVITVCGPVDANKMNPDTLHNKYPLLERSLEHVQLSEVPGERVMTLRPLYDEVVNTQAMRLDNAVDKRIAVPFHATAIGWTVFTHGKQMADFIHS